MLIVDLGPFYGDDIPMKHTNYYTNCTSYITLLQLLLINEDSITLVETSAGHLQILLYQ